MIAVAFGSDADTAALQDIANVSSGALIKSDVPAAFACVWFAYAAWLYWRRPVARRLALPSSTAFQSHSRYGSALFSR